MAVITRSTFYGKQQRWVIWSLCALVGAMAAMAQPPQFQKPSFRRLPQQQLQQSGPKCALVVPKGNGWEMIIEPNNSCVSTQFDCIVPPIWSRLITYNNRFLFDLSTHREICITQESINRAFNRASKDFRLIESRDGSNSEQLAETLLETSRLLALE